MSLRTQKIKGMDIVVPSTKAFTVETPPDMPQLHTVYLSISKRGGGKTVSIVNFLKKLQDSKCLDRLFIISPTIYSNKHILDMVKYDEDDLYEETTNASLEAVLEKVEQEAADYEYYIEQVKAWKKYQRFLKGNKFALSDDELMAIWGDGDFQPPQHRYGGKKPVMALFIDDAQQSELFKPKSRLPNVVIKHRHLGALKKSGGALGLSIILAAQSYKATGGGLPRSIRNQATLIQLFRTKDAHELDEIADECGGEIDKETFMKVYEAAIKNPHDFLLIDLHKKPTAPSMFKRNFNEWILLPEEKKHANDK